MADVRGEPRVSFGASQRKWVTDVMRFVAEHGGLNVVGTIFNQEDAVRLDYDVLVIDEVSSVLTHRLVNRLGRTDRVVVGVYDPGRGPDAKQRLLAAGVTATITSNASPGEFVATIRDAAWPGAVRASFDEIVAGIGHADEAAAAVDPRPDRRSVGTIVSVTGMDGRTEVTVGLAAALARSGRSVVVVDCDTLEPSVAQRLSVDLVPNVFTATEDLRLHSDLTHSFGRHPDGFAWIAGIPNPNEWAKLSEFEAADLIGELAHGFSVVLVKVPRYLPDLATFGTGPGRFDVGRRMVAESDQVVAVTGPSPLGASRLLQVLADVRTLTDAPVHVVINRAPTDRFRRGEIERELTRTFGSASMSFLPNETRVAKASWQGRSIGSGAFSRRVGRLAGLVAAAAVDVPSDPGSVDS